MDFMLAGNPTMVALLVFLAAGTSAFVIMALIRAQGSVKRRAAGIGKLVDSEPAGGSRSLRHSSLKAAQRVIESTTKPYAGESKAEVKVLRRRAYLTLLRELESGFDARLGDLEGGFDMRLWVPLLQD